MNNGVIREKMKLHLHKGRHYVNSVGFITRVKTFASCPLLQRQNGIIQQAWSLSLHSSTPPSHLHSFAISLKGLLTCKIKMYSESWGQVTYVAVIYVTHQEQFFQVVIECVFFVLIMH